MMGMHRHRIEPLHQFAKPALDPVALGGGAVLLRNRKADPDLAVIGTGASLQDEGSAIYPRAIGNGEEIRPLPQPIHDGIPKRASPAQALRRLRPRARRAAKTLRPPA